MTTASTPSRPDPTRTGAVWVTGTGAFLLLAAAAVFTAVRWDQIPEAAKLGAIALATGAFLITGRGLKTSLPATAGALFHLGAFLVPLDVAAIGMQAHLDWSGLLLAEGVAATVTFAWAAATERSVVLRWSLAGAVVALAGGIAANTEVPAPLLLAAFAGAALIARQATAAIGWAALAGAAPLLTFLDRLRFEPAAPFERLGLVGDQPRATAVLTGGIAAVVLGIAGRRRGEVGLALLGGLVAATGAVTSGSGLNPEPGDTLVGLAVAFLVVQAAAFLTRGDPFWSIPTRIVARLTELPALLATAFLLIPIVAVTLLDQSDARGALAAAVLGLGWMAADLRGSAGRAASTIGVSVAAVAAVALVSASPMLVAVALAVTAGGAVALPWGTLGRPRPGVHLVAAAATVSAPLIAATTSSLTAVLTGIAGSIILTEAAVRRSFVEDASHPERVSDSEGWAWILAFVAMLPGALSVGVYISATGEHAVGLIAAAVMAAALASQADRARTASSYLPLGTVARACAVAVLAFTDGLPPLELGLVALTVIAVSVLDAVRLQRPELALGAALAVPIAVASLCRASGLSSAGAGVALTVAAAVLAGLGAQLGRRWLIPVSAAMTLSIGCGLLLAAAVPSAFADALMVTGGIAMAIAIDRGRLEGVYLAGIVVTGGIWLRLADATITASELYLAPVAVLLLIAGLRARSIGTSSWIAYGPTIAVLGGAALAERIGGGAGWHAVVCGSVGVASVVAGGYRKLAAPLLLGTGVLVALAGYETLAITATLPTWTWLALGGSILLGAGVAMERHDLGPLETGKRLVDVVEERFA